MLIVSVQIMKPLHGLFIAPSLGAFFVTFAMCLSPEVASHQFIGVLFIYTFIGAFFGIISALIFSWPIAMVFHYFNVTKLWHYALGGFVCALPFWVAWFYPFNSGHWEAFKISNSMYFFSVGILSGIIYWYLVVRDQHTNKSLNQIGAKDAPPG